MLSNSAIFGWKPSRSAVLSFVVFAIVLISAYLLLHDGFAVPMAILFGSLSPRPLPVSETVDTTTHHGMARLRFSSEGAFKISILEDLHFGEGRQRCCKALELHS
jgi:hypothetical protein